MITTHVLDTSRGTPAAGLRVVLEMRTANQGWTEIGRAATDTSGRVASFTSASIAPGTYRLTFETGAYHRALGLASFFPEVTVVFAVVGSAHYHVPLLLSPYGYSTYKGT